MATFDGGPGFDGGPMLDAGPGFDGGPAFDGGPGVETGPAFDGGPTMDAGPGDSGPDVPPPADAGTDAPPFDAGFDAGPPPGPCSIPRAGYGTCTPARGCPLAGQTCVEEISADIGGVTDPITGAPAGVDPITSTIFEAGVCTPRPLATAGTFGACDPDDDMDTSCGPCGSCMDLGGVTMCLPAYEPNVMDNDTCRDGYTCSYTDATCMPFGCGSDDECRVAREDTNGVPGIQTPQDCIDFPALCGTAANFDDLVYDTGSSATCDTNTFLCTGAPSDSMASGGDACTADSDCEAGERCITEGGSCTTNPDVGCVNDTQCTAAITGAFTDGTCDIAWSGGSCIKTGCNVTGNECANDGVCQSRGLGVDICLAGCTMGMGATSTNPATWVSAVTGSGGCRADYTCFWNGTDGFGVADNGVCVPGGFNGVTTENVGAACTSDDDCWGPFGQQRCIDLDGPAGSAVGICTVNDCSAPYFASTEICGTGNSCADFGTPGDPFGLCLQGCTTGDDCDGAGIGCIDSMMLLGTGTGSVCFAGCLEASDCQTGETCSGASATTIGECI